MTPHSIRHLFLVPLGIALAAGCGGNGQTAPLGGALTVSGQVVDLQTGTPITGATTVTAVGLQPPPKVTVEGADFTIEAVPENSAFQLLASAAPTHRATYSPTIAVTNSDLDTVQVDAVSEDLLTSLASGFGVTPSAANGIVMLHMVDATGAAKVGVAGTNLSIPGADGPHFLDGSLGASTATATSASGWVVFFEVPPGTVTLTPVANATVTLDMPTAPVGAGAVTLADVTVTDGAPPALPSNVSFSNDVFPIFDSRGCVGCHSGNGPGRDLGGLTLDGSANLVYKELIQEKVGRVVVAAPETSLVLTMPSAESPPDSHPNVTFASPYDPDYLKILVWIREGALDN